MSSRERVGQTLKAILNGDGEISVSLSVSTHHKTVVSIDGSGYGMDMPPRTALHISENLRRILGDDDFVVVSLRMWAEIADPTLAAASPETGEAKH